MIKMITPRPKQVILPIIDGESLRPYWVTLDWHCPTCQKLRGKPKFKIMLHNFSSIWYNDWQNPCGHKDEIPMLIEESKRNGYNERELSKIRILPTHVINAKV